MSARLGCCELAVACTAANHRHRIGKIRKSCVLARWRSTADIAARFAAGGRGLSPDRNYNSIAFPYRDLCRTKWHSSLKCHHQRGRESKETVCLAVPGRMRLRRRRYMRECVLQNASRIVPLSWNVFAKFKVKSLNVYRRVFSYVSSYIFGAALNVMCVCVPMNRMHLRTQHARARMPRGNTSKAPVGPFSAFALQNCVLRCRGSCTRRCRKSVRMVRCNGAQKIGSVWFGFLLLSLARTGWIALGFALLGTLLRTERCVLS